MHKQVIMPIRILNLFVELSDAESKLSKLYNPIQGEIID